MSAAGFDTFRISDGEIACAIIQLAFSSGQVNPEALAELLNAPKQGEKTAAGVAGAARDGAAALV